MTGRTVHPHESERMRQEWLAAHSEHATTDEDSNVLESLSSDPEVRARPARDDELGGPRSGQRLLLKHAEGLGYDAVTTYARGPYMHATYWRPTRTADSIVVRIIEDAGPCDNCILDDEDPRSWCDGLCRYDDEPCRGSCVMKAHDRDRCPHPGRQIAVATWVDGKFEHAYWHPDEREKIGATELRNRLKERAACRLSSPSPTLVAASS